METKYIEEALKTCRHYPDDFCVGAIPGVDSPKLALQVYAELRSVERAYEELQAQGCNVSEQLKQRRSEISSVLEDALRQTEEMGEDTTLEYKDLLPMVETLVRLYSK